MSRRDRKSGPVDRCGSGCLSAPRAAFAPEISSCTVTDRRHRINPVRLGSAECVPMASCIPTQARGPAPKGNQAYLCPPGYCPFYRRT